MPLIRPLRALRYGSSQLAMLDRLVSPSVFGEPDDRRAVGDVDPLNIRHLVRGDRGPLAHPDEPPFTHAARLLGRWKEDGIIVRDPRPALYVYGQKLDLRRRRGLVCLVRLEPYSSGSVLPHERTRGGSTETLFEQLEATKTQLSLVMAVVADSDGALSAFLADDDRPFFGTVDGKGRDNRIWRDEDPVAQLELVRALRDQPAVIADGHHRYEAALQYQAARAAEIGPSNRERPHDYVMMMLVPQSDPGLHCEPAHRVCPQLPPGAEAVLDGLRDAFEIHQHPTDDALFDFLADPESVRFGMVRRGRRVGLRLRDDIDREGLLSGLPPALRAVDAAVVEHLVLDRIGADPSATGASGSSWAHNTASGHEVAAQALAGEVALALLLRPTPPSQVVAVASSGGLMPPKSTNFVPKPTKGLLMASLVSF